MRLVANPKNPWSTEEREWLVPPPLARLEVYEERARSIVSSNDSPDVGFSRSVNPYRGCFHGCAYCYARPTHQYLDMGAGTDFERRIVVKVNAPELLEQTFRRASWEGEAVAFSGVTDCYQPLEASYRLTRGCLDVCLRFRNPVTVITKGALVRRDADLLAAIAKKARAAVYVSVPFADAEMAAKIEPYAPPPAARFAAMRALADVGVPVGVAVAPIVPGLNESQIEEVLGRARESGAHRTFFTMLRLPAEVKDVFLPRLAEAFPDRVGRVVRAIMEMRGGRLNDTGFGSRMRGRGPRYEIVERRFRVTCKRLGFESGEVGGEEAPTTFRRPAGQGELFGAD